MTYTFKYDMKVNNKWYAVTIYNYQIEEDLMRIVKSKDTTRGLNELDIKVLGYLADNPNESSAEIAEGLNADKVQITMSINRLFAANLVYKTEVTSYSPGDNAPFKYFKYLAL